MNLPRITFTQQLQFYLLHNLGILHNIFDSPESSDLLWPSLSDSSNGSRIRYALALYLLGVNANRDDIIGKPEDHPDKITVLNLLLRAANDAKKARAIILGGDIQIRLFQTYRQLSNPLFNEAIKALEELKSMPVLGEVIYYWGSIILHLQLGLRMKQSDLDGARREFGLAIITAEKLIDKLFDNRDYKKAYGEIGGSILYYCAKAYWSYRFSIPVSQEVNNDYEKYGKEFLLFANEANNQIDRGIEMGFDDDYIAAIYYSIKAYLLIAMKNYPNIEINENDYDFNNIKNMIGYARSYLVSGSLLSSREFGSPLPIYNEHSERLDTVDKFKEYLDCLEKLSDDNMQIWKFYGGQG